MSFERGNIPKKSLHIGVISIMHEMGIIFAHNERGEPVFYYQNDPFRVIHANLWSPENLRIIADYIEAFPESRKIDEKKESDYHQNLEKMLKALKPLKTK